jgi:hypothetical protein
MSIQYYIMVDPDKPNKCKLGITKDPHNRIRSYRTANPNCYFLVVYTIPDKIHEKKILDLLKDRFRVQSEYVHCHPNLVKNIVECYLNDNNIKLDDEIYGLY